MIVTLLLMARRHFQGAPVLTARLMASRAGIHGGAGKRHALRRQMIDGNDTGRQGVYTARHPVLAP